MADSTGHQTFALQRHKSPAQQLCRGLPACAHITIGSHAPHCTRCAYNPAIRAASGWPLSCRLRRGRLRSPFLRDVGVAANFGEHGCSAGRGGCWHRCDGSTFRCWHSWCGNGSSNCSAGNCGSQWRYFSCKDFALEHKELAQRDNLLVGQQASPDDGRLQGQLLEEHGSRTVSLRTPTLICWPRA